MAHATEYVEGTWTALDLFQRFGAIPLHRVRLNPPPGTATEQDVIDAEDHEDRLCELIDGMLVEKTMSVYESYLAMRVGRILGNHVEANNLGIVIGPDAMIRLEPGQIRLPDVGFFSWSRLPEGGLPRGPIWSLIPDLAVEIVSKGNTPEEMGRKLREYFTAGVRLVWYVYPKAREAHVYTSPDEHVVVTEQGVLEGGDVLPGFRLELKTLFAEPHKPDKAAKGE
jgi:Uma2 family endonuclease